LAISAAVSWSDLALVVHTIRQQDNHFRLGLAILDTADSIRQPQTDRRPILDYTRLDILEEVQQDRMVGCQRALRETLRRKHDQTDIIVRTAVDESGRHIFGCFQTVRFQVLRHHTGRDIHCQHDVDTFRRRVLPTVGRLRTRQYHDEDSYRRHTQNERDMPEPDFPGAYSRSIETFRRRHLQTRLILAQFVDVPSDHRDQQQ